MRLFEENTTVFTSHGLGNLNDAISCTVTKAAMMYELQMQYPVKGKRFGDLQIRRIIYAKPDQVDVEQPFIIYRVSKAVNGKVTVYARHISYELSGIPTNRFTASSASDFATKVKQNALVTCNFNFVTDVNVSDTLAVDEPTSIRSLLSGDEDTWQGAYGGEVKFDGMTVYLLQSAGQNRGVRIRYGIDLIDATMEQSIASMYTGIIPFYKDETHFVCGYYIVPTGKSFGFVNAKPVDVSQYFATVPADAAALESVGRQWMADNKIGEPTVSLKVSYAQLNQVVQLYDTVTVYVEKLGINVAAKVSRTVYDVLRDRYESVDVGSVRTGLGDDVFDASRLRKGLLPVERIQDKSLTSAKYGSGSVDGAALADWDAIRAKLGTGIENDMRTAFGIDVGTYVRAVKETANSAYGTAYAVETAYNNMIDVLKQSATFAAFKENAQKDKP